MKLKDFTPLVLCANRSFGTQTVIKEVRFGRLIKQYNPYQGVGGGLLVILSNLLFFVLFFDIIFFLEWGRDTIVKNKMNKNDLYQILTGLFVACLLISNIIGGKTFTVFNITLPCSVIIFPIVFIVNDVMSEVYGFAKASRAIWIGFAMNILASIAYTVTIALPATETASNLTISGAMATALGSSWRILMGSFVAYLCGSLLNTYVMVKLKGDGDNRLMFRCVLSTLLGESVDALLFITIVFSGALPIGTMAIMIVSQAIFKTVYEFLIFPVTKIVIKKASALE